MASTGGGVQSHSTLILLDAPAIGLVRSLDANTSNTYCGKQIDELSRIPINC